MKKILITAILFLTSSCSVVLVYSPKHNCVVGDNNNPQITGSELDGNKLEQKSTADNLVTPIR